MYQLKIIWQKVKTFLKKYWIICVGSLIFLLLILIFLPIFHSSWLYYPEPLRAKIALRKLTNSQETAVYCREDCSATRLLYKNIISSALIKNKKELLPDLEKTITGSNVLSEIRVLLIKIWQESGEEPSEPIKAFYNNTNNPLVVRMELAKAWPQLNNTSFLAEVIGNFKTSSNDQERLSLLDTLRGSSEPVVTKLIWDIILNDYPNSLKTKAWFLLANINDKKLAYKESDFDNLKFILEAKNYPIRLKDQAIFILGDYYLFYPELSESLLVEVANNFKDFDNYQHSFVIDILNRHRTVKLAVPELSQTDLDAYFNNY